jgi:hypothetical protein
MAGVRDQTLVVHGYREFLKATQHADRNSRLFVRQTFRNVGELVRVDAQQRFNRYSSVSAAGYRVRVRQRGVAVEQSLRKTTGRRPDWGARQMVDALIPALDSKQTAVERRMEEAIDLVAAHFDRNSA